MPSADYANVLQIQPTSFTLNPPFGHVEDHELRLVFTITNPGVNINAQVDRTIAEVKHYLDWLRPSVEQMKRDLMQVAVPLIAQRKQQATAHAQIVGGLGIPIRQAQPQMKESTPEIPVVIESKSKGQPRKHEEWDVFVSHASEDKDEIARWQKPFDPEDCGCGTTSFR